jgi:hypothetical protein
MSQTTFPPFWNAFKRSVDGLNEFVKPLVLRRYQLDLLKRRQFEIVSPLTGARFTESGEDSIIRVLGNCHPIDHVGGMI